MATKRIPSLDGLRAISISMVLVAHLTATRNFPLGYTFGKWFALGELGVRVFFVISGYLITSLLIYEINKTGKVSLPKFYFRRTLRLFPAAYTYVLVVMLVAHLGWTELHHGDVLAGFTYTTNYHRDRGWALGHFWSLAVEEQFYFLWPALLSLLGLRRGMWAAVAFVLAAPAIRLGSWYLFPGAHDGIGETFPTVADAIACGCVLAFARDWLAKHRAYQSFQRSPLFILVPLTVFAANVAHRWPSVDLLFGTTIMNICIALCVDWAINHADSAVGRVLNARPLVAIGIGSYSIYLWQQLFINRHSTHGFNSFPMNLVLAVAAATLSYFLVEKPCLRLRERLEPRLFKRRPPAT